MRIFVITLCLVFISSLARAQNTGGVFPPTVNEGHKSAQYRITIDPESANGEAAHAQRLHYQQAINGDVMWRIVGQTRKTADSEFDFDFVQAELFWQLTEDDAKILSGVRFDARYRGDDRPEQLGLNWMNQFKLGGDWSARALVLTAAQFGDNAADGLSMATRGNIYRKLPGGQTIGFELYNGLGNTDSGFGSFKTQNHTAGPFVSMPLNDDISIYLGALVGLSERAADEQLRLWITRGF